MEITVRPTDEFVMVNEAIKARVWEGMTAHGVPCRLLVAGLMVPNGVDFSEFDANLKQVAFKLMPGPDPQRN